MTADLLLNAIVAGILLGGFYAAVTVGLSMSAMLWNLATFSHLVIGALPLTM